MLTRWFKQRRPLGVTFLDHFLMKQLARWVSIIGHPFVMAALLVAVPSLRQPSVTTVRSGLIVVLAAIVPVAVLMVRQVRSGRWGDVDASKASERPLLFTVALAALAGALGWLYFNDPSSFLVRGTLIAAAFVFLAALLTRWVKVSLHAAFAALTATALSLIGSPVGYALVAAIPLICWSRIELGRHRTHELLVGLLLGVATGVALVRF